MTGPAFFSTATKIILVSGFIRTIDLTTWKPPTNFHIFFEKFFAYFFFIISDLIIVKILSNYPIIAFLLLI